MVLLSFKNISMFWGLSDLLSPLADKWVGSEISVFTSFPAASVKINIILLPEEAAMPMHCIETLLFSLHIATALEQEKSNSTIRLIAHT